MPRPKPPIKCDPIWYRPTPNQDAWLRAKAEELETTISEIVRQAVADAMKRDKT